MRFVMHCPPSMSHSIGYEGGSPGKALTGESTFSGRGREEADQKGGEGSFGQGGQAPGERAAERGSCWRSCRAAQEAG